VVRVAPLAGPCRRRKIAVRTESAGFPRQTSVAIEPPTAIVRADFVAAIDQ
jgi:hypothetical protein